MFSKFTSRKSVTLLSAILLSGAPLLSAAAQSDTTGNGTTNPPNVFPGQANYGNNTVPTAGPEQPNDSSLPPGAAAFASPYNGMTIITPSTTTGAVGTTTPFLPGPQAPLPPGGAPPTISPYSTAAYGVGWAATSWASSAPLPSGYYNLSQTSPYPNPNSGSATAGTTAGATNAGTTTTSTVPGLVGAAGSGGAN